MTRSGEKAVPAAISAQREPLLEYIDYVPTRIDHIVKRSGLTAMTVSSMLIRFGCKDGFNVALEGISTLQNRIYGMTSPATK